MQLNFFNDYDNARTYLSNEQAKLTPVALEIHRRLETVYTVPDFYSARLELLDQLVYAILSQRTTADRADYAFTQLRKTYADWIRLLDHPVSRIEYLISDATYPEVKAPWLIATLNQILSWNDGRWLSLDFLRDFSDVEAAAFLRRLRGVSYKTGNATMLLSIWQRALLPVDTHGIRVRSRLGLLDDIRDTRRIHAVARALLPANWGAKELESEYYLIKRHGQQRCTHSDPMCFGCPLLDLCRYGQRNLHRKLRLMK